MTRSTIQPAAKRGSFRWPHRAPVISILNPPFPTDGTPTISYDRGIGPHLARITTVTRSLETARLISCMPSTNPLDRDTAAS